MTFTLRNAGTREPVGAGYAFADASGCVWTLDNWSPGTRLCYARGPNGDIREFYPHQLGLCFGFQERSALAPRPADA